MVDEHLRHLERLAAAGDEEAAERLLHWHVRAAMSPPPVKYYRWWQNNIMGILVDRPAEGIGNHVIVAAYDDEQAEERIQQIAGNSYNGYCECCGRRWGNPEVYNTLEEAVAYIHGRCYVHHLDGSFNELI